MNGATAQLTVASAAAMQNLGRRLAALLQAGDVVVLDGPLGAGKTTLSQGVGDGLGIRGPVTSPTFVLARTHPSLVGGPALVHVDAYRLGGWDELEDLDLISDLGTAVTLVEWGEGVAEGLAPDRLVVRIERAVGGGPLVGTGATEATDADAADDGVDEPRTVRLIGTGPTWARRAADLSALGGV